MHHGPITRMPRAADDISTTNGSRPLTAGPVRVALTAVKAGLRGPPGSSARAVPEGHHGSR